MFAGIVPYIPAFFIYKIVHTFISMKTRILSAIAGIVLAFGIVGFIDAKALPADSVKKDSIVVKASDDAEPIFNGHESNKVDSLSSVVKALNDTTLKNLIVTTIKDIKDKPAAGSDWTAYLGWIGAILFAVYEVFIYIQKRIKAKPKK